jgi:hypothetical protein
MSRHWLQTLLALAVLFALRVSVAVAEDSKSDPIVYEFGDELVHGELESSPEAVLPVRKRSARESLIRVREDWLVELFRAGERL